jgi:hypothetical protein
MSKDVANWGLNSMARSSSEKIRDAIYRLKLPNGAKLHDVFHVGLLKPFKGEPPTEMPSLPPVRHDRACAEPDSVLCGRLA